jgi:hypothetical protein
MSKTNTLADYMARRQVPGNCIRCARPNPDVARKTCPDCRAKVKARRERKAQESITRQSQCSAATLVRRVETLEMMIDNLRASLNRLRNSAFTRGRNYGKQEIRQAARAALSQARYRDLEDALFGGRDLSQTGVIDWDTVKQISTIKGDLTA